MNLLKCAPSVSESSCKQYWKFRRQSLQNIENSTTQSTPIQMALNGADRGICLHFIVEDHFIGGTLVQEASVFTAELSAVMKAINIILSKTVESTGTTSYYTHKMPDISQTNDYNFSHPGKLRELLQNAN